MIRRDAKLGFIISGILVAVLIVYVLVPTKKHDTGVPLDEGTKSDQAAAPDALSVDPPKPADSSAGAPGSTAGSTVTPPTTAPTATGAVATATDPFSTNTAEQPKGTDEDKWMLALNHGSVPPAMMTSAPPLPTHGTDLTKKPKSPKSIATKPPADSTPAITSPVESASSSTDAPTTQPLTVGKMNTHVVKSGETLSSIAKVAYGSANFYPYIVRANPGIVDKALKPGMTINLPPESDVKSGASAASKTQGGSVPTATGSDVKIDPTTEYQVAPGDSLAKIAMKLYGSGGKWQQIYDLNKETIGNDPQKLKLKAVLKLPEPPTVKS